MRPASAIRDAVGHDGISAELRTGGPTAAVIGNFVGVRVLTVPPMFRTHEFDDLVFLIGSCRSRKGRPGAVGGQRWPVVR